MQSESEESNEFDDEIFNLSFDLPRKEKSRSSRKKSKKDDKGSRKSRTRKGRGKSKHSEDMNLKVESRSMPFTKLLNRTNINFWNTTTV